MEPVYRLFSVFELQGLAMPHVEIVVTNILPCYTFTILKMNETEHAGLLVGVWVMVCGVVCLSVIVAM